MDPARPKTICAVVWQDSQFSWTNDGLKDSPKPGEAWEQAKAIAADVTANWRPDADPTQGSVMFHASGVKPDWHDNFNKVVRIDGHIFYNNG
jgi:spore germination cell wall hydrolase CwlJ-like protein